MFRIPSVLDAEELLDKAFGRATKITQGTQQIRAIRKLVAVRKTLIDTLRLYVKGFPSLDQLHPFYRELIDILIGIDALKQSLGAVDWATGRINRIVKDGTRKVQKQDNPGRALSDTYGRIASVLRQINSNLLFLQEAGARLNSLPVIDMDLPTVIIAGFPNVGKSSLLALLSSAKPEIALYPFTTKNLILGHIKVERQYEIETIQLVEAPGLLDRPQKQRNDIEKQGMLALRYLPKLVVFMVDPTFHAGYDLNSQMHLLDELRENLDVKIIVVENKTDISGGATEFFKISCATGEGIDTLKKEIIGSILS